MLMPKKKAKKPEFGRTYKYESGAKRAACRVGGEVYKPKGSRNYRVRRG